MTKRWTSDRKIALAFTAALALLAALPMVVYQNKSRLLDSSRLVVHTHEVLDALEAVRLSLVQAESEQRGYLVSGRVEYLEPYKRAAADSRKALARATELTVDNADQQRRLEQLRPLIARRLFELEQACGARLQQGPEVASRIVQMNAERGTMAQVRHMIAALRDEEARLLEQRCQKLRESVANGTGLFWVITALNFATVGASLFCVNRYMMHRRRTEASLKRAAECAEAANVAKSAFLANMSHELRTPMTAIIGYADVLLEPGQSESDRLESLQTIRRNARHLLDLISDVLDISKIEAGKMTAERVECDLPQLVSDVVSMMRSRALEKGLTFELRCVTPAPRRVWTDPLRLKQILVNLLGNAVKFCDKGGIELRVSFDTGAGGAADAADGAAGGTLRFEVADTGIGINDEQIGRLFQPFMQADASMTRRFGGSGLGLVISQRLAALLGGGIRVQSRPGLGSTFTLTIDAGAATTSAEFVNDLSESVLSRQASAPVAPVALSGTILLAEDGYDNQRLISAHLRAAGAEVVIADNGQIALDLAMARPFDLVLMDMQMPEIDGYAAASELRRRGLAELPIVALTAHAMVEDRAKCIAAGCSDYLSKPVDKQQLLATVQRHLSATQARRAKGRKPIATGGRAGLRSTFADEPEMQQVLREYVAGLPRQVAQVAALLDRRDMDALRRAAHQIKGAGGGYGFMPLTDAAAKVERLIMAGAAGDAVARQVRELLDVIRSVQDYEPENERQREAA
ncbi:MAG TPA: CHASE3 domain-containing protein [Tepidisphaeraceae bacterium]|nr:CHASE3 domain-containing protein [Tepidisphaeraceae bacterium]